MSEQGWGASLCALACSGGWHNVNERARLGCPTCRCYTWVFALCACLFADSLIHWINRHQSGLTFLVKMKTAPHRCIRTFHQSPFHRIAVHVLELLPFFMPAVNIAIVKSRLPESRQTHTGVHK